MAHVRGKLLACVAALVVFGFAAATVSADQLLTGSITSGTGQKIEGVQIAGEPGSAWRDPCRAARRATGHATGCPEITCSEQRDTCRNNGPARSEGLCVTVLNACMQSGVWDATVVFPHRGLRS
jgi:hypothetical protein